MGTYLKIAERVLSLVRQPLGSRQILEIAKKQRILPDFLYGKTQHKTLQARLSEDIRKGSSPFIRTQPGRFFLREFLSDPEIEAQFKQEFPAPIRADQLMSYEVLCLEANIAENELDHIQSLNSELLLSLNADYHTLAEVATSGNLTPIRIFIVLYKGNYVLARRSFGRLGDPLSGTASLGLIGYARRSDRTMFSVDPFGTVEASVRILAEQLELDSTDLANLQGGEVQPSGYLSGPFQRSIAALVKYQCTPSLDPVKRFGSSGAFYWHSLDARLNNIEAFDPWSRYLAVSNNLTKL